MVLLQFDFPYLNYNKGETAGFPEKRAAQLLNVTITTEQGGGQVRKPVCRRVTEASVNARAEAGAPAPAKMVRVKFTHHAGRYGVGEVAAFPEAEARAYVEGKMPQGGERPPVAVYVTEPVEVAAAPPVAEKPVTKKRKYTRRTPQE